MHTVCIGTTDDDVNDHDGADVLVMMVMAVHMLHIKFWATLA